MLVTQLKSLLRTSCLFQKKVNLPESLHISFVDIPSFKSTSLVPRSFLPLVLDCLQYASDQKLGVVKGLGMSLHANCMNDVEESWIQR